MTTFIALLRGINVGGHQLKMADLRAPFVEHGCTDVETYIRSGNVVFRHRARTTATLAFDDLDLASFAPEEPALVGRELYLKLPNGTRRALLPNVAFKLLGTPATTRNWRTVEKLHAMANA